jgi:hypothetical protein
LGPATPEATRARLILAALAVVLLLPIVAGGPPYYRDLSQNLLPVRMLAASLREAGESTGWNPYLGGGVPLAANPNWLLHHPGWWLDRLVPPVRALPVTLVLHTLLAAVFWAAFLSRRGLSGAAASAGAAVLAFSGPFLSLGTLPNLLTAAAWIPPALYFLDRARCGARWSFPLAIGCGGASLMAADPASALALLAGACLAVSQPGRLSGEPPGPAGVPSARPRQRAGWWSGPRLVVLFVVLSLLLAGIQLLPAWEMVGRSERGLGFDAAQAGKWSLHPARLPELVVAGWLGDPTPFAPGRYWGAAWLETGLPFLLPITVGIPALVLAGIGFLWRATRRAEWLTGSLLAIGGILLAFGGHLPGHAWLVSHLPGAAVFRYPEKMLLPALLGLSLLAGLGVERITSVKPVGMLRPLAAGLLVLGAALGLCALTAGAGPGGAAVAGWFFERELSDVSLDHLARSLGTAALFSIATAAVLAVAARPRTLSPGALGTALLALTGAQLAVAAIGPGSGGWLPYGLRANPAAPPGFLDGPPAPVALAAPEDRAPGGWRTFRAERPAQFAFRRRGDSMAWGFEWDRLTLNRSWPAGYRDATAYDRPTDKTYPVEVARAAEAVAAGRLDQRLKLWSIDAVRYITSYEPLAHEDLVPVGRLEGVSRPALVRYENRSVLPRARLVSGAIVAEDAASALRLTLEPRIDPAEAVVLEREATAGRRDEEEQEVRPASARSGSRPRTGLSSSGVELRLEDPTRLSVRLTAGEPGWLVLAENYDPDWHATMDGEPVPVHRAYGFLRAVEVPAGEHLVVMTYRPRCRITGALTSVLGAMLAIGAALILPAANRGALR